LTNIFLASASPRRKQLLAQLGLDVQVIPNDSEEHLNAGETAEAYVLRVAQEKAQSGWKFLPPLTSDPLLLAADTAVVVGENVLGKPLDESDARQMWQLLSGNTHQVLTAVVITDGTTEHSIVQTSLVTMRDISSAEMHRYWNSGEPFDKAGGYAVQGLGAVFICELKGSYSGVMGLPLYETAQLLNRFGVSVV